MEWRIRIRINFCIIIREMALFFNFKTITFDELRNRSFRKSDIYLYLIFPDKKYLLH